jgi:hypothetical protein
VARRLAVTAFFSRAARLAYNDTTSYWTPD